MPVVKFPYGKDFLELDIPESRYAGTLVSDMHHYNPGKTQEQLVQEALEHPVKIPAMLCFFDKVPLHVTRPVRWDSDLSLIHI